MNKDQNLRKYIVSEAITFRKTNEIFGGLSNMAPGFPIFVDEIRIRTVEALYQACRFPHRLDIQAKILGEKSPMTAKMVTKPYRSCTREDWNYVRVAIMRWCLRLKLIYNWNKFSSLLLKTGDKPIVEVSRSDDFWGAIKKSDNQLVGVNALGRLLMELREQIRLSIISQHSIIPALTIPNFSLLGRLIGPQQFGSTDPAQVQQLSNTGYQMNEQIDFLVTEKREPHQMRRLPKCDRSTGCHWKKTKIKFVATINPTKSKAISSEETVCFLPMEKVSVDGRVCYDEIMKWQEVANGFTDFERGDVLVAKITPCFENGKGAYLSDMPLQVGVGSTEFIVLRPSAQINGRFLYFLTFAAEFRRQGVDSMTGAAGQQRVSNQFVANFEFSLPPRSEQDAIVAFLDRKLEQIDRFIAAKQRLIALLQEQKTALINRAVTKGLNPDAPMKHSGIDWLGEIPAHWEVKKLKRISPKIGVGLVINPSTYFDDQGTVPFLLGGNLSEESFRLDKVNRITEKSNNSLPASRLSAGDVVTVRVGYPGTSAVIPAELDGANCGSMIIIRRGNFNSLFLCRQMNSFLGGTQIGFVAYGAAQKQFNVGHAVDFIFPVPPREEQNQICDAIDKEFELLGAAISKAEREIELIQELRTTLISDAVTGRITTIETENVS